MSLSLHTIGSSINCVSLLQLLPQQIISNKHGTVSGVVLTAVGLYGLYKGFEKWICSNTNKYKISDDKNIFIGIINGCISSGIFAGYVGGTSLLSVLFMNYILLTCPAYIAYLFLYKRAIFAKKYV
jgi:hypothetical protein